jgi:hypothetical protein
MSVFSIFIIATLFFVQTLQNAVLLVSLRHKVYDDNLSSYIKAHDAAFVFGLILHAVATGAAFLTFII